ncbi:MAG: 6-phosphofructokinase [Clostridiaceae bacterium]|nr:6-phosphofructokinase [Clostridiaceae bacterium]
MTDAVKHGLVPWSEDGGIRTVGVLTNGGDAPGMNAAIRAVVRAGLHEGYRMLGCRRGFHGLWRGDMVELDGRSVSGRLQYGGTFLMTARSQSFNTPEGVEKAFEMCRVFCMDALVVIGGDGSLRGALDLSRMGLPVIGIPSTIDNDVGCSEYAIGYDTALNTAMSAIDKLRDTATSHERCSCIEVMGRRTGYIALNVGVSCGAEVILIPEVEMDFDRDVARRLLECHNSGKSHYIVVVAEGAGDTVEISNRIETQTGIESRVTILGHLQRGGSPSTRDRMMASWMGTLAIKSLVSGDYGHVVSYRQGRVITIEIEEALQMTKTISPEEIETAYQIAL